MSGSSRSRSARPRRVPAVLASVLVVLLVAACGGDDGRVIADGAAEFDEGAEVATTAPTTTAPPPVCPGEVPEGLEKPEVAPIEGEVPTELKVEDLEAGDGEALESGAPACFHYVGVAASNDEQFDASWDSDKPFETTIGTGQVIQGWDLGLVGMKVGGRRRLVIPPALAYGEAGSPPAIAANETLIFVIDLLGVGEKPPPTTTTTTTTAPAGSTTTGSTTTSTTEPG